jgi:hypothetical protein
VGQTVDPRNDIFRPNSPPVIHETIDREAILVNLVTGTYYQLTEVGADVWEALDAGVPADEIGQVIAERYGVDRPSADADVAGLVRELRDEELIVADPAAARRPVRAREGNGEYRPPRLSKFTDMQDLLLLDPVHEVDETGWPSAPA